MKCKNCGENIFCKNMCRRCYDKNYYQNNKNEIKTKTKEWHLNNKIKSKESYKKWIKNNPDYHIFYNKQWIKNNPDYHKKYNKEWYKNNKEYVLLYNNKYKKLKMKTDINYKLKNNLSDRILLAIKNQATDKAYSSIKLLGCSVQKCRKHLEKQFKKGMTWENHTKDGWHIDHIKPLVCFDLTKESEQLKAFNYKNLQPLWAKENLKKGGKY